MSEVGTAIPGIPGAVVQVVLAVVRAVNLAVDLAVVVHRIATPRAVLASVQGAVHIAVRCRSPSRSRHDIKGHRQKRSASRSRSGSRSRSRSCTQSRNRLQNHSWSRSRSRGRTTSNRTRTISRSPCHLLRRHRLLPRFPPRFRPFLKPKRPSPRRGVLLPSPSRLHNPSASHRRSRSRSPYQVRGSGRFRSRTRSPSRGCYALHYRHATKNRSVGIQIHHVTFRAQTQPQASVTDVRVSTSKGSSQFDREKTYKAYEQELAGHVRPGHFLALLAEQWNDHLPHKLQHLA
ncbi:hypothetical protein BCR44DRAFT_325287 [Catenaria anguillulae PL171]|uniref:Uncharacterized protein n=1 Tax=Catenaria anguillulae PL171 TaxID=765915 RepID=A0A1Y2H4I4_9FUNG|nr:hypothetical protein BCR44DRAFT_325287 [Catenaria anguillulae PL171]